MTSEPIDPNDMRPVRALLRREVRLAVDSAYACWAANPNDVTRLVDLKNATDHAFQVEMALAEEPTPTKPPTLTC